MCVYSVVPKQVFEIQITNRYFFFQIVERTHRTLPYRFKQMMANQTIPTVFSEKDIVRRKIPQTWVNIRGL